MKKIFTYLTIAAFAVFMTGCGSYLDIQKHGSMGSVEDFYQTDTDAEQAIAQMYYGVYSQYFYWYMNKNLLSDDSWCGGGSRGDQVLMERLNEYHFDTDNTYLTYMYTAFYTSIYYCNLILDNLEPDTAIKQRAYAEAKVIRAWEHFELVTLYKTAPIVDHVLGTDEYHQGNSTPEETWAFIEDDLTEAINSGWLHSKTGVNDQETGIRVTKEFAQALLGKAYLFQEKYSQAASMLENVINSGLYALWTGDYDELLHVGTNNCCESMFEVQSRDDANNIYSFYNYTWCFVGWRVGYFNMEDPALSELAAGTYGFCNPQQGIVDAFIESDGVDGYRYKNVIRTVDELEDYGMVLQAGQPLIGCEGYLYWKLRALKSDLVIDSSGWQVCQYIDGPIMRYAEVLLLAAEAQFQSGNTSKALDYVNQIRNRAQVTPRTSITLDDIKTEKRLELCMESVRFQDLVRWGDAATVMAEQGKQVPVYYAGTGTVPDAYTNTEYGFKSKHNALPIPNDEMIVNPNMVQNEGW